MVRVRPPHWPVHEPFRERRIQARARGRAGWRGWRPTSLRLRGLEGRGPASHCVDQIRAATVHALGAAPPLWIAAAAVVARCCRRGWPHHRSHRKGRPLAIAVVALGLVDLAPAQPTLWGLAVVHGIGVRRRPEADQRLQMNLALPAVRRPARQHLLFVRRPSAAGSVRCRPARRRALGGGVPRPRTR